MNKQISVTDFWAEPTGRYTFRINGVRHWTDVRGWGLYTAREQDFTNPATGYRRRKRVQVVVASPGEFRLPGTCSLAASVVQADVQALVDRRAARAASSEVRIEQGNAQHDSDLVAA